MAAAGESKFSLPQLTAMVVGSMIGAGIFSLPQTFGRATGPFGALVAWTIAGFGMFMLAKVFQNLAQRKPDLDSGVFAYAKAGFGEYWGFLSAVGYWAGTCIGNVTYWLLIMSTLGALFPVLGEGNTPAAIAISSVLLWGFHFLVLRGVKEAAGINTIVTIAKVVPILIFVVLVAFAFDAGLFRAEFWGGGGQTYTPVEIWAQIRSTMLVTVFVFLGIEGASVYSRYAKSREDVGTATILGFVSVLCLLVLVTVLSFGILPRAELAGLRNPSMGAVLAHAVGPWGGWLVGGGLIVSVLGAYLAWSLMAAEVLFAAAKSGTMPKFLARENAAKVPAPAMWMTTITIQAFLILSGFAQNAFLLALELTSSMNLIPYFLVAAFALKLVRSGDTYAGDPAAARRDGYVQAGLATVYTIFLLWAGGLKFLLLSAIIYALGSVLFYLTRKEQGRAFLETTAEKATFAIAVIAALAAVYGLASGGMALAPDAVPAAQAHPVYELSPEHQP